MKVTKKNWPLLACTAATAAILAGCNIMQLDREYADAKPVMVPVTIDRSLITTVGVQLHPTDPHRAYVRARAGVADESWKNGNTEWMARLDEFRAVYQTALLSVLSGVGKSCSVTRSFPYPDAYSIDFEYQCAPSNN